VRISRVFGMRELARGDAVERVVRVFTRACVGESDRRVRGAVLGRTRFAGLHFVQKRGDASEGDVQFES